MRRRGGGEVGRARGREGGGGGTRSASLGKSRQVSASLRQVKHPNPLREDNRLERPPDIPAPSTSSAAPIASAAAAAAAALIGERLLAEVCSQLGEQRLPRCSPKSSRRSSRRSSPRSGRRSGRGAHACGGAGGASILAEERHSSVSRSTLKREARLSVSSSERWMSCRQRGHEARRPSPKQFRMHSRQNVCAHCVAT